MLTKLDPPPNFHFLMKIPTHNHLTFRTNQVAPRSLKCPGPDPPPNIHHITLPSIQVTGHKFKFALFRSVAWLYVTGYAWRGVEWPGIYF